jgi:hypothetical protein
MRAMPALSALMLAANGAATLQSLPPQAPTD